MRSFVLFIVFLAGWIATPSSGAAGDTAAPAEKRQVVILGDSLAAGYGIDPNEAFPALLQSKIDDALLPFEIVNAGLSGDTSAGGARRIHWLLRRKIDVLIIELGGNDGLRGIEPSATRTNLQAIIQATKQKFPGSAIILAGMEMPGNMGEDYTRAFKKVFEGLSREHRLPLIPFLLEGVGGKPELNLPDRIHPTPEGHKIIAETVWKTLRPILEARVGKAR